MISKVNEKSPNTDGDEIDLGRLIGELIDYRKLIIAVTSIFTFLALGYALLATPIYQANALVQVEQRQGNAILNSLSQMLPDGQPQSAPEMALLQSRMILGKTVDDLNLQAQVTQNYFPIFGQGIARLMGEEPGRINVKHLFISDAELVKPEINLTVIDDKNFQIDGDSFSFKGKVGEL
ncbi:TPA: tyrosine-protein kinase, partial [Klebsiella pneumoniae]|nr:tyrosine-protein kinase [Klebsiella pneumoniae]